MYVFETINYAVKEKIMLYKYGKNKRTIQVNYESNEHLWINNKKSFSSCHRPRDEAVAKNQNKQKPKHLMCPPQKKKWMERQ